VARDNVVSSKPPARPDAGFPQVVFAAVLLGGAVAVVDRFDRKAAAILTATLLMGVMLSRDIVGKATELVDAVTGGQSLAKPPPSTGGGGPK
jgi:hypothetical protein